MSQFLILALICLVLCAIGLAIDVINSAADKKSKNAIYVGYAVAFVASLLIAWAINSIPVLVIYGIFIAAVVFFARYLMRKFASRKV